MVQRNSQHTRIGEVQGFARRLDEWMRRHGFLIDAVASLRDRGDVDAAEALLSLRELTRLRLSWELWEAIALGDGRDPDVLDEVLDGRLLATCRWALWGRRSNTTAGDPRRPRLSVVDRRLERVAASATEIAHPQRAGADRWPP